MNELDSLLDGLAWVVAVLGGLTILLAVAQGWMSHVLRDTIGQAPITAAAGVVQIVLALFLFNRGIFAGPLAQLAQVNVDNETITAVSLVVSAVCLVLIAVIAVLGPTRRRS